MTRPNEAPEALGQALYLMIVPKTDNDGNPFSEDTRRRAEEAIHCVAAGRTTLAESEGIWENGGRIYRERVDPFFVVAPDDHPTRSAFETLARDLAAILDQIAVFHFSIPLTNH